ncbi:MAG: MBOAT family protein [Clostridia bacterium]|nr:MBOAT family protein [Clostridia bacterium]
MELSGLLFLYAFLPLSLGAYFISRSLKWRNGVLLVFSLLFYAWGDITRLPLLVLVALINFLAARLISRFPEGRRRSAVLCIAIIFDLALLAVYKYTGFVTENINALFGISLTVPKLLAPLGVSFYTFRLISYLLDVHWEKTEAEGNFARFLMYVSLFPCTVSGPIVRYADVKEQLTDRKSSVKDVADGLCRLACGLAKKVIIADKLAVFVDELFTANVADASVAACWLGAVAFALQVYFDFSGYTDMAIGLARIFGITFPENFNSPFLCSTIAEFWQRWHITLGSFFRDYLLYVPIFGRQRKYLALFLVWFSTGIWHGASWNYIIWGLFFGAFILIETLLGKKRMKKIPLPVKHIYTKLVLIIGFGIFRFTDTKALLKFLGGLFGLNGNALIGDTLGHTLANNAFLFLAALICTFPILTRIRERMYRAPIGVITYGAVRIAVCAVLLVIASILLVSATTNPFLYANF